jgi:hypothetical protein
MPGPFTTITVDEYNKLRDTIKDLRARIQSSRELLEKVLQTSLSDDAMKWIKSALSLLKESDI